MFTLSAGNNCILFRWIPGSVYPCWVRNAILLFWIYTKIHLRWSRINFWSQVNFSFKLKFSMSIVNWIFLRNARYHSRKHYLPCEIFGISYLCRYRVQYIMVLLFHYLLFIQWFMLHWYLFVCQNLEWYLYNSLVLEIHMVIIMYIIFLCFKWKIRKHIFSTITFVL